MTTPRDAAAPMRNPSAALRTMRQRALSLLGGVLFCASAALGQVTSSAVITPAAPTYVDPVMLHVTVTAGTAPSGSIVYSVDGGAVGSAPVSNGAALFSLGTYPLGSHSVSYHFEGAPGNTAPQTALFTASNLPFALLWTRQTVIDNHGGWADSAPDANNNMLLTNRGEGKLYRMDPLHNLSVVPVTGIAAPAGIATDAAGNAYIADATNNAIRKLTASGQQSTLAIAGLLTPTFLALDPTAASLYINDSGHSRIVRYTLATGAQTDVVTAFDRITGLATDPAGLLYFAQRASYGPGGLFRLEAGGTITGPYFGVNDPEQLHADSLGNLYVADGYDGFERFDTAGHRTWIDNNYVNPIGVDHRNQPYDFGIYSFAFVPGPAAALNAGMSDGPAQTNSRKLDTLVYAVPSGTALTTPDITGASGNLNPYSPGCSSFGICSQSFVFSSTVPGLHTGSITGRLNNGATLEHSIFGVGLNSNEAFDPGVQTEAPTGLTSAGGMAEFEDGTLFVSDTAANRVYSLPAGGGAPADLHFTGLNRPTEVAVDGEKTAYVLDTGNGRVVSMTAAGQQRTVYTAGAGALTTITAIATDGSGALYLGGQYGTEPGSTGPAVVELDLAGQLRLIKSVPAEPTAITLDGLGNIWEAEGSSGALRRITDYGYTPAATIANVATGLQTVAAIAADPSGTVFVAQGAGGSVIAVRPDGTTFPVYTGLGNASALAVTGQSVLYAIDSNSNTLLTDDRRTTVFAFGKEAVGTTSAPMQRLLSNDGNQVLSGPSSLPGDSTFLIDGGAAQACVVAGTPLALGGSCTLTFRFAPPYSGAFNETGYETDNTPNATSQYAIRLLTFTGTGVQGTTATLTPSPLNFGSVTVGSTAPLQVLTLQNTGAATLDIASFAVSGDGFQITAKTCGTTLAAGSACTVSVSFTPTSAAAATGTVTVTDDASNAATQTATQTAALSGTGTAAAQPTATLTPAAFNFGTLPVTSQSDVMTFVLTNTGTVPVQVTSFGLSGTNAGSFGQFREHTCSVGQTLAPGVTCNLFVYFQPTATGAATATLSVADTAGTQTSVLTGNGTAAPAPAATLTPPAQDFGTEDIGRGSPTQTFILASTGSAPLNLQSIAITGTDAESFAMTGGNCPVAPGSLVRPIRNARQKSSAQHPAYALSAGSSCTVNVVFTPGHSGGSSATLTIADDAGTQTSALTGTGNTAVVTAPQAALNPASSSFGTVNVGESGATQTFTLANAGNAALPITAATITGANSGSFHLTANTCNNSLAAGANCTYTVSFTPTATGTATATLSVTDAAGTQTAALTGTANAVTTAPPDFTLTVTPATQTGARGSAIVYTVQLRSADPANPFTGGVALTVAGLPLGASAAFAPATVTPGTTQTANSQLTVTEPTLSAANAPLPDDPGGTGRGTSPARTRLAALLASFGLAAASFRRRRLIAPLLALLLMATAGIALTGCGTGTGFAPPANTSTLTVTGTGGSITHTATVTLTVR